MPGVVVSTGNRSRKQKWDRGSGVNRMAVAAGTAQRAIPTTNKFGRHHLAQGHGWNGLLLPCLSGRQALGENTPIIFRALRP